MAGVVPVVNLQIARIALRVVMGVSCKTLAADCAWSTQLSLHMVHPFRGSVTQPGILLRTSIEAWALWHPWNIPTLVLNRTAIFDIGFSNGRLRIFLFLCI